MHETAIANDIVQEVKKYGDIKSIYLEIGELAHVPAADLVECLKRLVDWNIYYSEKKAKISCTCGYNGFPTILERGHDHFLIECPKCKKIPEILEGTQIKITKITVK